MIRPTYQTSAECSGEIARYLIAQHTPDLLRKETRNVGVLVQKGDDVDARFIGVSDEGKIVRRHLRSIADPTLYGMWVRHWQKAMAKADWQELLLNDDRQSFSIIPGGEVSDTGMDSVHDVCTYLFSTLVSPGGLREALEVSRATEESVGTVREEMRSEMRQLGVMASSRKNWVNHPVFSDHDLKGSKKLWHRVSFYQETSTQAWAFEPLNFSTPRKRTARERAGYLALVLGDIKNSTKSTNKPVDTSVVVHIDDEDREDENVKWSLAMIEGNARIIDWHNRSERERFLQEREDVARAA